jgi:hypothetical protein
MGEKTKKERDDEYIASIRALSDALINEVKQLNDVLEGIAARSRAALSGAKYIDKKGVKTEAN